MCDLGVFGGGKAYESELLRKDVTNMAGNAEVSVIARWPQLFINKFYKLDIGQRIGKAKIIRISDTQVAKRGPTINLAIEFEAMRYVAQNTSIPLPRAYRIVPSEEHPDYSFLVMDYVEGEVLAKAWRHMTTDERGGVTSSLATMIDELRSLPSSGMISSTSGGPFYDYRFAMGLGQIGPFENERDFNDWRISQFHLYGSPSQLANIRGKMREDNRIVFTHGDLSQENILVRRINISEFAIVAILDWEQAGWRPEYWEAVKFVFGGTGRKGWLELGYEQSFMAGYRADITREFQELGGLSGGLC
ncbi:hypothetical protein M413DRAFT_424136 [Hebeloma cylindrosporum]|uniref:Aminoglycoside phosphotransferase domain-containing protein n=1 Tax=Hebeloma cylindrosporum TaxID=76867 RepID=A0A0C2XFN5_HEBCY|nr:hypothetical protein M413DRAFT_424136 [Hebeloma cylindrosporum h7]